MTDKHAVLGSILPEYTFTLTPKRYRAQDLKECRAPWAYWVEEFRYHATRADKDGPAYVLGSLSDCPAKCAGTRSNCGGGKPHRLAFNVRTVQAFGVDLDKLPQATIDSFVSDLRSARIAHIGYHTHGHEGPEHAKARVIIPLAHLVLLDHPRQWSGHYWPILMSRLGLSTNVADHAVKDPSRIFYTPAKPSDASPHTTWSFEGDAIDAQATCGPPPPAVRVEPRDFVPLATVDMGALRDRLADVKGDAGKLVRNVLNGKPPVPPPAARAEGLPSRYEAWRTVTFQLALASEDGTPAKALLAVLHPSYVAAAAEDLQDATDWCTIEGLLNGAIPAAERIRAERNALFDLKRKRFEASMARIRSRKGQS